MKTLVVLSLCSLISTTAWAARGPLTKWRGSYQRFNHAYVYVGHGFFAFGEYKGDAVVRICFAEEVDVEDEGVVVKCDGEPSEEEVEAAAEELEELNAPWAQKDEHFMDDRVEFRPYEQGLRLKDFRERWRDYERVPAP